MGKYGEDQLQERRDMPIVIQWLRSKLSIYNIQDASQRQQKEDDIDFTGHKQNGDIVTFEAKIRRKLYDDILIETVSNTTKGSPGWVYVSKADVLVYVFLIDYEIVKGFIIDMKSLKAWWKNNGRHKGYPIRYGKTSDSKGNLLYKTRNHAVPERDIPSSTFIYHPTYGLINPITDEIDSSYFR